MHRFCRLALSWELFLCHLFVLLITRRRRRRRPPVQVLRFFFLFPKTGNGSGFPEDLPTGTVFVNPSVADRPSPLGSTS